MSYMNNHKKWFKRITNDASGRTAATEAGIAIATLNRQLGKNELSAETVIALARAYGVAPVAALVQTGYLEPNEGGDITAAELAEILTGQDLIRLLAYRIDDNPDAWAGTFDEVLGGVNAQVFEFPKSHVAPLSDDEIADAIREANEMPQAAHTDDGIEYTEPELP